MPSDVRHLVGMLLEQLSAATSTGAAVFDDDGRYVYANPAFQRINPAPSDAHRVGLPVSEVMPAFAETVEPVVRAVAETGEAHFDVRLEHDGRSWSAGFHRLADGERYVVGTVINEITAQLEAEALARKRTDQADAVAALGFRALARGPLRELYAAAIDALNDGLDVELALVLSVAGDDLRVEAVRGWPGLGPDDGLPVGRRTLAAIVDADGPTIIDDVAADADIGQLAAESGLGLRGLVGTSVVANRQVVGVIVAAALRPEQFVQEDTGFVSALAHVLGSAVEREQHELSMTALADARADLVMEANDASRIERTRLAERLHDDVLQDLLYLRHELLETAERRAGELDDLLDHLTEVTRRVRRVTNDLHPLVTSGGGMQRTLVELGTTLGDRAGMAVDVVVDVLSERSEADETAFLIGRELMTNVARHAGATKMAVRLLHTAGHVHLEVSDDGVGFPPERLHNPPPRSLGLRTCMARAEALNGSLDVERRGKGGTRVVVTLPLAA